MSNESNSQYSLAQILGIWAAAALPMGILFWVVLPALVPSVNMEPGIFLWVLMIIGLLWQVVLSLVILYREEGTLNLSAIRHRTWRQQPRDPNTGKVNKRLWWWLIPMFAVQLAFQFGGVAMAIDRVWTLIFPFLAEPPGFSMQALFETPERWVGAWYLVGLMLLQIVGNYLWGEEFLFRSVLLPKMKGVFGKWDWLANAVLFGTYHLHKPWIIPSAIVTGIIWAYPSRRFRNAWFGLIGHGAEGLFILFLIIGMVAGLA